jgi:hypothetical protein
VQVAVEAEHHLIITHEVSNEGSDRSQLSPVAKEAKAILEVENLDAVADRGYFNSEEILACEEAGITVTLPKPMTSNAKAEGRFGKQDFRYVAEQDVYICPAGERLAYSFTTEDKGLVLRRYATKACQNCVIKNACTTAKQRLISRWEHEHVLEAVQRRLDEHPEKMRQRRETVEHPFGTIKAWMGATHFLMKTLPKVATETAHELKEVAASVQSDPAGVILGHDATETRVKQAKLDQYRIVYFATHGLLAGNVADFAKLSAEPALVLSLPEHPTESDDGLLTASEVAQLKLNAAWVVLSACNTASAEKPGAEALSGLARAFFYAGARSLIVSNWEVNSDSAVELMVGTFAALAADQKLSHAEALQKSMLAMIDNARRPERADPKHWTPFDVVGEPAKPAN